MQHIQRLNPQLNLDRRIRLAYLIISFDMHIRNAEEIIEIYTERMPNNQNRFSVWLYALENS